MKKNLLSVTMMVAALLLVVAGLTGCTAASQVEVGQQPEGIWVSGSGDVTVAPDIAILRLGIVSQEATIADAQAKASGAMTNVMKSLTDSGLTIKDIQTGSFSINQRTRWDDQKQMEVTTGYQVTNMVTVKIRETGKVGIIIDSVVAAGGDLIRINGISFSVEDPSKYYQQAREKAMDDAANKAGQIAKLAGLTLGKPTYIAEGAQSSVVYRNDAMTLAVPAPEIIMGASVPPISAGETKITLNVQVAYSTSQ